MQEAAQTGKSQIQKPRTSGARWGWVIWNGISCIISCNQFRPYACFELMGNEYPRFWTNQSNFNLNILNTSTNACVQPDVLFHYDTLTKPIKAKKKQYLFIQLSSKVNLCLVNSDCQIDPQKTLSDIVSLLCDVTLYPTVASDSISQEFIRIHSLSTFYYIYCHRHKKAGKQKTNKKNVQKLKCNEINM